MYRGFWLVAIWIAIAAPSHGFVSIEDAFSKSYALVVGIDHYPSGNWDDLDYAVADAQAVEAFLVDQGFKVTALYNEHATREAIVGHLEGDLAKVLGPSDRFIFFFAGHGHTEFFSGGIERGYLVPHDGKDRSSSYLAMSRIRDLSDILGVARHQLYIMDSCYGGRLGSRGERESLDPRLPDYLDQVVKRKARQILTAGGATQQVQDTGPDGHSVFTGELLKALNQGLGDLNGDGYISFYELSTYLQTAASRPNQTPGVDYLEGHGQGEFIFRNPVWRGAADVGPGTVNKGPLGPTRGRPVHELVKEGKQKFVHGDLAGARPLFQEAADLGNTEAMFFLGVILFKKSDPEGLKLVTESASRGHVPAMKALLEYYQNFSHFDAEEVEHWRKEIAYAEALAANTRLFDPTGGEASRGDPEVPAQAVQLSAPKGLRVMTQ